MQLLKQSTAVSKIVGPVLDSTGAEYASAVIGDLSLSKNGGTLTALAASATLTYVANGMYTLALTTGNTDTLGSAEVSCNKAGYQMPPREFMVLPATVYDALVTNATTAVGGLGDIQRMAGTALTARDIGASVLLSSGTGTGQVSLAAGVAAVNVTQFGGTNATASGGRPEVNATHAGGTAWGSGAITAAAIAADAITAAKIADGAIDRAAFAADTGLQSARSNTAQSGAAGTITLDASASATTDFYKGMKVYLTGGTGAGQGRLVTAYNGTTKVATVAPNWATAPDNTSTFAVAEAAQADVQLWAAAVPNALISGRVDANAQATASSLTFNLTGNLSGSVGSVTGNVGGNVTGSVGSVNGNVGGSVAGSVSNVVGNVGGNVAGSVGSVATGGITSGSFASNAITAAAIAADAIGASELAADAVAEIQSGLSTLTAANVSAAVWNAATASYGTTGTYGELVETNLDAAITSRQSTFTSSTGVTLPATVASPTNITAGTITTVSGNVNGSVASVSGNVLGSVASIAAGGIVAASFAANAITAGAIAADAIGASELAADAVAEIQSGLSTLTPTDVAGAVWNAGTASYGTAGSYGLLVETNLDAAVTTRMATYTQPTGFLAATFPGTVASTTNITAATGVVLSGVTHTGAVIPTVTAVGTLTTYTGNIPQTGDAYARLGAPAGASVSADVAAVKTDTGNLVARITSTLFSGITSMAQWLGLLAGKQTGNTTARTELRATGAGSGTYDETTDSQESLRDRGDAAWTTGTGTSTLTAADVWTHATRVLTAGTNIVLAKGTGVTGFNDLSAAQVNAEADTALADAGVTTTVTGRIDAAVSSRMATFTYTAPANPTDYARNNVAPSWWTAPVDVSTAVNAINARLPSDPADASDIAAAFTTVNAKLDAIDDFVDAEVAAIKAKTDLIPAQPAAVGDIPTAAQNAAAWGASVVGHGRTRDYFLQGGSNKVVRTANAFTVYTTDDVSVLMSSVATEDGTLDPLASVDPA